MFVIRQVTVDDSSTLLKLAKMVHFINLPADPDIIRTRISTSRQSFGGRIENANDRLFMFVLEDTETGNIIGTSSISSAISWPGHPHTYFKVRKRQLYSEDLQTGQVHVTLQLELDESGPSEIGGLILSPSYRGHRQQLGMLLSMIRFHFMGLHRDWFNERIIAQMMGALTPDSHNLLWAYLGRRFINLDYTEADRFCQQSKEFITSLLPRDEIYISLLPPEARQLVGRVSDETMPARRMLERLGFSYDGHIDPFDGGPYLEANAADIPVVANTRTSVLGDPADDYPTDGLVSITSDSGFRAVRASYSEHDGFISIHPDAAGLLGAQVGDEVGYSPLSLDGGGPASGRASAKKSRKKTRRKSKAKAKTKTNTRAAAGQKSKTSKTRRTKTRKKTSRKKTAR